MVSAKNLRHFTTNVEDSSHCHPLICMNHTIHYRFLYVIHSMWCHFRNWPRYSLCQPGQLNCISWKYQTPPMKIIKSFVVILYIVNAINLNLANLQSELIVPWLLKYIQQVCLLHVKKDHHVPNALINDGCQFCINGISVGVKEGGKLIPVMMTCNPIPQAIIEVVSCGCKTNCCIGGVNAIKCHCIAHSFAKGWK